MQLGGGGGAGGVAVAQSRVLDELGERNPAALCGRPSACWAAARSKRDKVRLTSTVC